jgi:hypothetical protein
MPRVVRSHTLYSWAEIRAGFTGPDTAILLGNGASRAVASGFAYASLFEEAQKVLPGFSADDLAVFDSLGTHSFEQTLAALRTTAMTLWKLERKVAKRAMACYESIRQRLIEAVGQVHIEWEDCEEDAVFQPIGLDLKQHGTVFSTNYDLLVYWSAMNVMDRFDNRRWFNDFFRHWEFVLDEAMMQRRGTRLMYLHGALHLYKTKAGETRKLAHSEGRSILELFRRLGTKGDTPLFVAEGDSGDKVKSIKSSDYLSFVSEQFDTYGGPLVVFGHSLGVSDEHLLGTPRRLQAEGLAVSVHVGGKTGRQLGELMDDLSRRLLPAKPVFFDASTHPLGNSRLRMN